MPRDLPPDLVQQVQNHTGAPWWNGAAYAEFRGYPQRLSQMDKGIGDAVDDLADVIEWLREEKMFGQSDRLRTIAGRLARLRRKGDGADSIREIARGWK